MLICRELISVQDLEINLSMFDLFQRDTRWLALASVDIDPGDCTPLQLFAPLRREDDHPVFRVDLRRIDDLLYFVFVLFRRDRCFFLSHIEM